MKINDWSNTNIILSDDRIVEEGSKYSNFRVINKYLYKKISVNPKPNIKNIVGQNILSDFNELKLIELSSNISNYGNPDLAILGLGIDGHTASLFPNKSNFGTANNFYTILKNESEKFYRISLTFDYIEKANEIMFILAGKNKAKVFYECLFGNYAPDKYPAQYLFRNFKGKINIFCDKDSVSELDID